jgi:hypothetical protein
LPDEALKTWAEQVSNLRPWDQKSGRNGCGMAVIELKLPHDAGPVHFRRLRQDVALFSDFVICVSESNKSQDI